MLSNVIMYMIPRSEHVGHMSIFKSTTYKWSQYPILNENIYLKIKILNKYTNCHQWLGGLGVILI